MVVEKKSNMTWVAKECLKAVFYDVIMYSWCYTTLCIIDIIMFR